MMIFSGLPAFSRSLYCMLPTVSLLVLAGLTTLEASPNHRPQQADLLADPMELNSYANYQVQQPPAQMFAIDQLGRRKVLLLPAGLLDETLLKSGSFSFASKRVNFNKLRVLLGNVYVRKVNGRLLRETYLLKKEANKPASRTKLNKQRGQSQNRATNSPSRTEDTMSIRI